MSDDEQDWSDDQSGPFCRHFSDPSDCDIKCAACGHRCPDHGYGDGDRECMAPDCQCQEWKEPPD